MTIPTLRKVPCPCDARCGRFLLLPLISDIESSITSEEADEVIAIYRDAERFRWMMAHPVTAANFQYQRRVNREKWIDEQMT